MPNPFTVLWHHARKDPLLWTAGVGILVGGSILVIISHEIEGRYLLVAEVLRELGTAMSISVLIAAFIEMGLARKTFEKGLDAVMKQTVPPEVWAEIKQHVISQPVLRHDWVIVMNITPKERGKYVSTTTVGYGITSLRDLYTHEVHHEVDGPRVPDPNNCFQSIKVAHIPEDLKKVVKDNRADFSIYFPEENSSKDVELVFEEWVKENDVITWWMNAATLALKVQVNVPATLDVKVHPHHPEEKILTKISNSCWECKGVMLPGQGFEIRLSPVQAQSGGTGTEVVPSGSPTPKGSI